MAGRLVGAYVQAWVWIDLDPGREYDDERIRQYAADFYNRDGEIEIDTTAEVSRSYEGG